MSNALYMVTCINKPLACGTLSECWRYVMEMNGRDARISDVAEMGITIEPAPSTMKKGLVEVVCH